jgi:hypothetical protein
MAPSTIGFFPNSGERETMESPMSCSKMDSCSLFPLFSTQAFLRVWQLNYCEGDYTRCARYKQALCGERVPATLLPNGKHLPVLGPSEDK